MKIIVLLLNCLIVGGLATSAMPMGKDVPVPRMTKEELRPLLGHSEVIILDVRVGREWEGSKEKIQGAVREDPKKDIQSWAGKYPKDKTLVLYCS